MNRFIGILIIIFLALFVIQHSQVFRTEKVWDPRLGAYKEEYHTDWNNLAKYLSEVSQKITDLLPKKR